MSTLGWIFAASLVLNLALWLYGRWMDHLIARETRRLEQLEGRGGAG